MWGNSFRGVMKKFILIIALLPLLIGARSYSFEELAEHGLANSYNTRSSQLSYESSRSVLNSAKWNLLPEANLSGSADYKLYNPSPLPGGSDLSSSIGINISKVISLNDAAWFNYRYASIDAETAAIRLRNSRRSYVFQVFGAYLEVLNSERQLRALEENLRIQTRIWDQSKALQAQGKITAFDVKQNEIASTNSRISILKMRNNIDKNRQALFGLIGLADEGFPLDELAVLPNTQVPALDYTNIEPLKLLEQETKRSNLSLKQTRLDYLPKISLSYSLSRNVSGPDFEFDRYSTGHGVGLNISYSLWNQFRHSETAKRSRIAMQQSELQTLEKRDEIAREYQSIVEELAYLQELQELYTQKLEQAAEQIRIAEQRYSLGMIQQLELDKTRSEHLEAEINHSSNKYQIIARREALNYLLSNQILGKW